MLNQTEVELTNTNEVELYTNGSLVLGVRVTISGTVGAKGTDIYRGSVVPLTGTKFIDCTLMFIGGQDSTLSCDSWMGL